MTSCPRSPATGQEASGRQRCLLQPSWKWCLLPWELGALCISESPDTQCTGKFCIRIELVCCLLQPFSVWSTFCCSHPGKWWLWSPTQSLKQMISSTSLRQMTSRWPPVNVPASSSPWRSGKGSLLSYSQQIARLWSVTCGHVMKVFCLSIKLHFCSWSGRTWGRPLPFHSKPPRGPGRPRPSYLWQACWPQPSTSSCMCAQASSVQCAWKWVNCSLVAPPSRRKLSSFGPNCGRASCH